MVLWLDHLPWLAHYAAKMQGATPGIFGFRRMAHERSERRHKGGAARKDLMYFLVRPFPTLSCPVLSSPET